jgi:hypothetical protein
MSSLVVGLVLLVVPGCYREQTLDKTGTSRFQTALPAFKTLKKQEPAGASSFLAEREGFEPSLPLRVNRFSRRLHASRIAWDSKACARIKTFAYTPAYTPRQDPRFIRHRHLPTLQATLSASAFASSLLAVVTTPTTPPCVPPSTRCSPTVFPMWNCAPSAAAACRCSRRAPPPSANSPWTALVPDSSQKDLSGLSESNSHKIIIE